MLTKFIDLQISPLTPNSRSYLNHFIQADTVVPEPGSALSFNRYTYSNNNPINYTDPTGHWAQYGDGYMDRGYSPHTTVTYSSGNVSSSQTSNPLVGQFQLSRLFTEPYFESMAYGGGPGTTGNRKTNDPPPPVPQAKEPDFGPVTNFINRIPGSAEFWNTVGTGADVIAGVVDAFSVSVVISAGIYGAGIPAALLPVGIPEVPVTTGLIGMGIAELLVQPIIKTGNSFALAATFSTVISETKAGNTRIEEGIISTNALNSITLTVSGFALPPEAFLSLILQGTAITNDLNWTSFPFPHSP